MIDNRQYKQIGIFLGKDGLDRDAETAIRDRIQLEWLRLPAPRTVSALADKLKEPRNRMRRLILSIAGLAERLDMVIIDGKFLRKIK
jgi:hypothetical protein